jgi:hypothetical protein
MFIHVAKYYVKGEKWWSHGSVKWRENGVWFAGLRSAGA